MEGMGCSLIWDHAGSVTPTPSSSSAEPPAGKQTPDRGCLPAAN